MSTDAYPLKTIAGTAGFSHRDFIEALTDLLSIMIVHNELVSDKAEEERGRVLIMKLVNYWIELLPPVQYVPGLINEVYCIVKRKLWETEGGLSEELLRKALIEAPSLMERIMVIGGGELESICTSLSLTLRELLKVLHGGEVDYLKYRVLNDILSDEPSVFKASALFTAILLSIVIASNAG
ncbi:MAG: hypothetical protein QXN38_02755 [Desulfurococcaceae archaeon]